MTRKITFGLILGLLVISCILIIFGTQKFILNTFETVAELKEKKEELDKNYQSVDKAISTDMPNKKKILQTTIEQYQTTKSEYETMLAQYSLLNASQELDEEAGKDIYDVEFLWTIIGNYATEEGINLKFDISPNTTSPQAYSNDSKDYVICDLKFSVTGAYINLTDFIYDIEDDDRLSFEINDFDFKRNDNATDTEPLNAKFNVYAVKINKLNLIENYSAVSNNYIDNTETSDTDSDEVSSSSTSTNTTTNSTNGNTTKGNTTKGNTTKNRNTTKDKTNTTKN